MQANFFGDLKNINDYWNKKVIFFTNQNLLKSSLPSTSQLINFCKGDYTKDKWMEPLDVNVNASKIYPDGSHRQFLSVGINAARQYYLEGFTLCFGDLSTEISQIISFKQKAGEFFGHVDLIAVTGYLSPPKSTGVLHYDRQHNFFIQREGVKRWFVSDMAAIPNPYDNLVYSGLSQDFFNGMEARGYKIRLPNECGRTIYELNPGDVLYIPPGFYHSPETLSEPSLHYTLTVEPACFWKDFNKQIFSKMLESKGKFFMDYRFLSDSEKNDLINECMAHIFNKNK